MFLIIILTYTIILIFYITVSIGNASRERLQFIATNSVNNNTHNNNYILAEDIITLKNYENYILRSHEITFTINDKTYQEVIGHKERIGGNDEVCYLKSLMDLFF